jgi:hypothetical protein
MELILRYGRKKLGHLAKKGRNTNATAVIICYPEIKAIMMALPYRYGDPYFELYASSSDVSLHRFDLETRFM